MNCYRKTSSLAAVTISAGILVGCAATPDRPVEELAEARASVKRAEQAGARKYSSAALNMARDKLEKARDASDDGNYALAGRLAEEARLDADYAAAVGERGRSRESVEALRKSINTLREEIRRAQGG